MGNWARRVRLAGFTRFRQLWRLDKHTISGTITDFDTTDPVGEAEVQFFNQVTGIVYVTAADVKGKFAITIPTGIYDMFVIAIGYETEEECDVDIHADDAKSNVALTPLEIVLTEFDFLEAANPALEADVVGTIDSSATPGTVTLELPVGSSREELTPSWTIHPQCQVMHNGEVQISGKDVYDFSDSETTPLEFVVVEKADITNSKTYEVTVTVAQS
jgi:hypothetical protein